MLRALTTAFLFAALLAVQGCGATGAAAPEDAAAPTEQAVIPQEEATQDTGAAEESAQQGSVTVAYEDAYKSIFLLDQAQIEGVTGLTLTAESIDAVGAALAQSDFWRQDSHTAPHSELIYEAFAREGDRVGEALHAVLQEPGDRFKVFVLHKESRSIAHVQIEND